MAQHKWNVCLTGKKEFQLEMEKPWAGKFTTSSTCVRIHKNYILKKAKKTWEKDKQT